MRLSNAVVIISAVLIASSIIGLLAFRQGGQAPASPGCKSNLRSLVAKIDAYRASHASYPVDLSELENWLKSNGLPVCPDGQKAYAYSVSAKHDHFTVNCSYHRLDYGDQGMNF